MAIIPAPGNAYNHELQESVCNVQLGLLRGALSTVEVFLENEDFKQNSRIRSIQMYPDMLTDLKKKENKEM